MFGVPFESLPPEWQEMLRRQQAMAEMSEDDMAHGIQTFMVELNEEQGLRLMQMLHRMGHSPEATMAHYWEGLLTGIRHMKFGFCTFHGVDHSKEMEDAMMPPDPVKTHSPLVPPAGDKDITPAQTDVGLKVFDHTVSGKTGLIAFSENDRALLNKYHLDDLYDQDSGKFVGFKCTGIVGGPPEGCGMIYASLDDRMLREPEECGGCFARTAHG